MEAATGNLRAPPRVAKATLLGGWQGCPLQALRLLLLPQPPHSQGPQLGHVVEAGHGDGSDVVVVQGPAEGRGGQLRGREMVRVAPTPAGSGTHPLPIFGWMDGEEREGMWAGDCSCPLATYRTSRPRRARKAPSSMQLIWFLSSCLQEKAAGALLGQRRAAGWLPVLPADPKFLRASPCPALLPLTGS